MNNEYFTSETLFLFETIQRVLDINNLGKLIYYGENITEEDYFSLTVEIEKDNIIKPLAKSEFFRKLKDKDLEKMNKNLCYSILYYYMQFEYIN